MSRHSIMLYSIEFLTIEHEVTSKIFLADNRVLGKLL